MSRPDPFSEREVSVLTQIRDELLSLDDLTGGWTTKVDVRQTGFSLHVKFDNKVGIDTSIRMSEVFDQASVKLCQVVSRLLDQIEATNV